MKISKIFFAFILSLLIFSSCKDNTVTSEPVDNLDVKLYLMGIRNPNDNMTEDNISIYEYNTKSKTKTMILDQSFIVSNIALGKFIYKTFDDNFYIYEILSITKYFAKLLPNVGSQIYTFFLNKITKCWTQKGGF